MDEREMSRKEARAEDAVERKLLTLALATRKNMLSTLRAWKRLTRKPLCRATHLDAYRYAELLSLRAGRNTRMGEGTILSRATIREHLSRLRSVYAALHAESIVTENPIPLELLASFGKNIVRRYEHALIPFENTRLLLAAPTMTTRKGRLARAALSVLLGSGLRAGELRRLRLSDLRAAPCGTPYLRLRETKSGREQRQVLPGWALAALEAWLVERQREGAVHESWVFTARPRSTRPIGPRYLIEIFRHHARIAGLDARLFTPHSTRVTGITKLITDGVPLHRVQEFSRHASLQTVERYFRRTTGLAEHPGIGLDY